MSLRTQVMRGGTFLVLRQGLGVIISLGGVLLLTRTIGPEKYGLYIATYNIFWYLQTISQLGIEVYIVRREGEENSETYHQAFTLLLFLGLGGMLLSLLGLPLLNGWVRLEGFGAVAQVMFLGLPVVLLSQVPLARLERHLDYRRVAMVELSGQIVFFIVTLPLAFQGLGVWAPVAGWWTQQLQTLGLLYWMSSYRPRFYWDLGLVKQMLSYSVGFSASFWVWQLRILVNPLVIGRYAGAEAVGYVALAIRIVEVLSFVKTATWRLAIATLGRLQRDTARLKKAVTEGMGLQILALGPLLVGFSWVGPWLIPLLFGSRWRPVIEIYPFIAVSYLSNAMFNLHSSALYVLQRNWEITVFHLAHIALFGGAVFMFVPRLGLVGYGWAEILALCSYIIIHFYVTRSIGSPDYRLVGLWWGAFVAALFIYQLGWWAALGLVTIVLLPNTHQRIFSYFKSLRSREA
ncbi:MAG: oligosaccharide flippase family protein [Chroococcidiopsidaceae cyanobacterium CP_BM_ER_R8_30]|nr:oligosaccharide flippase family protein [Chroococcidiopsidaceae cyanobacterium CP_BM_ER_R8_30]